MANRKYDTLHERILAKVTVLDTQNENACWLFTGKLDRYGYGRINLWVGGQHSTVRVHKLMWEAINGPLPEGMTLDHLDCVGKSCCNPDHLEPVTRSENSRRSWAKKPRGWSLTHPR